MSVKSQITVDEISIVEADADPSITGNGLDFPIGSITLIKDKKGAWQKTGSGITQWTRFSFANATVVEVNTEPAEGQFSSIADACDSILDSSDTKPYVVAVAPGIYVEREINVPTYTQVRGSTIIATQVQADDVDHNVFNLSTYCEVSFLSLSGAGTGYAGVSCLDAGNYSQLHKISIFDCDIGIYGKSITKDCQIYLEYVDINNATTYSVQGVSTNGFSCFINAENFYVFTPLSSESILVDGPDSNLQLQACGLEGQGTDKGILITNGAYASVHATYFKNWAEGICADSNGTNPTIILDSLNFENCTLEFHIANPTASGHFTGYSSYLKRFINNSSSFFISYKDAKIITVAKKGGDFDSVNDAVTAITDSAIDNPYVVLIGPGEFTITKITLPGYVTVVGSSIGSTILIASANDHDLFDMGENCELISLTIRGAGTGHYGIMSSQSPEWYVCHKVSIYDCDTAILVDSTTAYAEAYFEYVDIDGTYTTGLKVKSDNGNDCVVNCENFYIYSQSVSTVDNILLDGPNAQFSLISGGITGNGSDVGVRVTNGASIICRAFVLYTCATGIISDAVGSNPYLSLAGISFDDCTMNFDIHNATATGNFLGYCDFHKRYIDPASSFFIVNKDAHVFTVYKKGGDFSTIADALSHITDSAVDNRYIVMVGPGEFTEPLLEVPQYTSIVGSTIQSTLIIADAATHHILKLNVGCEVSFLSLQGAGTGYAALAAIDSGIFTQAHKVSIYDCDIGILVSSSTVATTFYGEYVDTNNIYHHASKTIAANGFAANVNLENYYNFPTESLGVQNLVTGTGSELRCLAGEINTDGSGTDTAFYVEDGGRLLINGIGINGCGYGVHVGNVGANPYININAQLRCVVKDVLIEHPGTIGSFAGSADMAKVSVVANTVVSMSYTDNGSVGHVVLQDLYQGDVHSRLINLSKLVREASTMGLVSGGDLSRGTGRHLEVAAGSGFLIDPTDQLVKEVPWEAASLEVPANSERYVYVDTNSVVQLSSSYTSSTETIRLGRVYADATDLDFFTYVPMDLVQYCNKLEEMLRGTLGGIFGTGCTVSENVTTPRSIDVLEGAYFYGNTPIAVVGGTAKEFEVYYRATPSGWNNVEDQTVIDNLYYDDGSGTLAPLTAEAQVVTVTPSGYLPLLSQHFIQTINGVDYDYTSDVTPTDSEIVAGLIALINADSNCVVTASGTNTLILTADVTGVAFTHDESTYLSAVETNENVAYYRKDSLYTVGGLDEKCFLVTSQQQYATYQLAEEGAIPTPPPWLQRSVVLIATIIVQKSGVHFYEIIDNRTRLGFTPQSASVITSHDDLSGRDKDANHGQYLLISGTRAMTGNLPMGGNSITGVNLVDGVDVSTHASRHLPNSGTDALTCAAPSANLTSTSTNAAGGANSLARSDHSHAITTAVAAQQTPDQTNAAGSSTGLAKADHVHNIPTATVGSVGIANAQGSNASFANSGHIHQGIHQLKANSGGTARYGDVILQQGTGLTIVDNGSGTFTLDTIAGPNELYVTYPGTGLTVNYTGGKVSINGTYYTITAGSVLVSASSSGWVYVDLDGVVKSNFSTTLPDNVVQMASYTANTIAVTALVDSRALANLNVKFGLAASVATLNATNTASAGTANTFARTDHVHPITTGIVSQQTPDQTNAAGASASLARIDHVHNIPTGTPSEISDSTNTQGSASAFANQSHIHSHGNRGGGTLHAAVTTSVNGFMIAADKTKLDGIASGATNTPLSSTAPANVDKSTAAVGVGTTAARADHKHDISTAAPSTNLSATTSNAEGSSANIARSDHSHAITTGIVSGQTPDQTNAAGASASLARIDHVHNIPTANVSSIGIANAQGSNASFANSGHVHQGVHSIKVSAGGTARYGDLVLLAGTNITLSDDGSGNLTINATTLKTKSGLVANTSFSGTPKKATVTFSGAFTNTNYSISIRGIDVRNWTYESKTVNGFVINANANFALTGEVSWIAIANGEV